MHKQKGFTLIEIAIVLVIIGLLLGGILKGQQLIDSARVKNLATDFRNISTFIYAYQDRFHAIPGDDAQVDAHLGAPVCAPAPATCAAANGAHGNGVIEGAWGDVLAADSEAFRFWQHVRAANLAPGPTNVNDASFPPENSLGSRMGAQSAVNPPITGLRGTYVFCSSGIQGRYVRELDTTMDDGDAATGSMMAMADGAAAPAAAVANANINDATPYTVCMAF